MNNPNLFSQNLRLMRDVSRLSMTEFSKELHIPKSTLQSVLQRGQTTLDTACRIADSLKVPLSTLLDGSLSHDTLEIFHGFLLGMAWYRDLHSEDQREVADAVRKILEVLQK